VSQRDRATPHNFHFFSLPFARLATSIACCRAFSQIIGRRAVPLRHLSYLLPLLFTVLHSFSLVSIIRFGNVHDRSRTRPSSATY